MDQKVYEWSGCLYNCASFNLTFDRSDNTMTGNLTKNENADIKKKRRDPRFCGSLIATYFVMGPVILFPRFIPPNNLSAPTALCKSARFLNVATVDLQKCYCICH